MAIVQHIIHLSVFIFITYTGLMLKGHTWVCYQVDLLDIANSIIFLVMYFFCFLFFYVLFIYSNFVLACWLCYGRPLQFSGEGERATSHYSTRMLRGSWTTWLPFSRWLLVSMNYLYLTWLPGLMIKLKASFPAYKKKIGFTGQFLIEPKPKEPTKHQYDYGQCCHVNAKALLWQLLPWDFACKYRCTDHHQLSQDIRFGQWFQSTCRYIIRLLLSVE